MTPTFTTLMLAAVSTGKITFWSLISATPFLVYQGAVQGGISKLIEFFVDHIRIKYAKDKNHNICKEQIDMSDKTLDQFDWVELESPLQETPFSLNLSKTNVTDQDLIDHLAGQKLLRKLDVSYCDDITYQGVKQFKKLRPDCSVVDSCSYLRSRIISGILLMIPITVAVCELLYECFHSAQ